MDTGLPGLLTGSVAAGSSHEESGVGIGHPARLSLAARAQRRTASTRLTTSSTTALSGPSGLASPSKVSKLVRTWSTRTLSSGSIPLFGAPSSTNRPTSTLSPMRRRSSRAEMTAPTSGSRAARARSLRMAARSTSQKPPKVATKSRKAGFGQSVADRFEQAGLALELVVDRGLGYVGLLGDGVDGEGAVAAGFRK